MQREGVRSRHMSKIGCWRGGSGMLHMMECQYNIVIRQVVPVNYSPDKDECSYWSVPNDGNNKQAKQLVDCLDFPDIKQ